MVTIQTDEGELQRHLDQVRPRQSPAKVTKASSKQAASVQETALVPPEEEAALAHPVPGEDNLVPQLRRSRREKPIDRYSP